MHHADCSGSKSPHHQPRRALLIFAEDAALDLARRKLPGAVLPLLQFPWLREGAAGSVDLHAFTSRPSGHRAGFEVHLQRGASFGARLENAVEQLTTLGYDEIVAVGRDCPSLNWTDIATAFDQLNDHGLVLGPDHRGGCYLIAFRAETRSLLRGIRWRRNTDCAQLCARAGAENVSLLAVKHDLDSASDLSLAARGDAMITRLLAFVLASLKGLGRLGDVFVDPAMQFIRLHSQLPPPASIN